MDFLGNISFGPGSGIYHRRCADGVGAMTAGTSLRKPKANFGVALKQRLSRPRYLIMGNWLIQVFIVLVFIFFRGLNTPHAGVMLQQAPEDMARVFGDGDSGSYLKAALSLVATGHNTQEWAWVLNLWPPGMVWLDASIVRFSPLDYGVTIGLITALVWSAPLAVLTWPFMRRWRHALVVLLVEFAILGTSPFQSWMFDKGLFYADGLSAALFLLGLSLSVNRVRSKGPVQLWIRDGIYVGIAFAATIYLRASYQLVPWALAAIAIATTGVIIVKRIRGMSTVDLGRQAVLLIVAALTVPILMHPYTTFVQQERDRTQFVMLDKLIYVSVWKNYTVDSLPQWLLDGGVSVGCDIDPSKCALIQRAQADGKVFTPEELRNSLLESIATHPLQFVSNRGSYVARQWYADEAGSYSSSDTLNPGQGLLYLVFLISTTVVACILAARGTWALMVIPVMALAVLAPLAIAHVEVRYLIPLKMIGLLAPMLILMLREQPTRSRGSKSAAGRPAESQLR